MRTNKQRIYDIIEAIGNIEKYTINEFKSQLNDERTRIWFLYHFMIIGEASTNLPDDFKAKYSMIPWREIIGLRNILVHGYFEVDLNEIWSTAVRDLPELKKHIYEIIEQENF